MIERKPSGYWMNFQNVQKELEVIIEEIGHFPTTREINNLGKFALSNSLHRYHGGSYEVALKLKKIPNEKPKGYWSNWENIKDEIKKLIEKLGHFPTTYEIHIYIKSQDFKKFGGINGVKKRLGYEQYLRKTKKLNNWIDFKKEFEKIIIEKGKFPSQYELRRLGRHDLLNATYKYYGNFSHVREKLGYNTNRVKKGYWKDLKYALEIGKTFLEEHSEFLSLPRSEILEKNGLSSFSLAIAKYHGGFEVFREKLQQYLGRPAEDKKLESMLEHYVGGKK